MTKRVSKRTRAPGRKDTVCLFCGRYAQCISFVVFAHGERKSIRIRIADHGWKRGRDFLPPAMVSQREHIGSTQQVAIPTQGGRQLREYFKVLPHVLPDVCLLVPLTLRIAYEDIDRAKKRRGG